MGRYNNNNNNNNGNFDDDNVLGAMDNNNNGRRHHKKCCNNNDVSPIEEVVYPTRTVVNNNTNHRTVRSIRPIEVINVNRTVVRNENYYPVTERDVNETVVEEYDCGTNPNNPNNCRPRRGFF